VLTQFTILARDEYGNEPAAGQRCVDNILAVSNNSIEMPSCEPLCSFLLASLSVVLSLKRIFVLSQNLFCGFTPADPPVQSIRLPTAENFGFSRLCCAEFLCTGLDFSRRRVCF
jgi:hypothetical protein